MEKQNRFFSFELFLAILFIIAFFLPWLDMWGVKVIGWDIPVLQKKLTKVINFFKFFSKKKDWIYSTHVVYLIPFFSAFAMLFWIFLKKKTSQIFLMITGIFSIIVVVNLFYKLPKAGSGVYLLAVTSVVTILYLIVALRKKKKKVELEQPIEYSADQIDILE